ncbi:phiSA1p31-related protein [Streptomyces canus]|uniref:phiSA1p31-related protein n=1 Tax=Streptomyces canus TaxID=58343 RepID=UPI0038693A32|nr:phiSA1p31-related protein [Streptomyces canus]
MTETFEVGQKVRHSVRGDVEIAYGPFTNSFKATRYLVRLADGRESPADPSTLTAIPEPPKFAAGDVVSLATRRGAKATVEYGPFDDGDVYVVKLVDEPADEDAARTFTAMAHVMTKVDGAIKVGDRVRVVAASYADEAHGKVGTAEEVNSTEDFDGIPHPFYVTFGPRSAVYASAVERVEDENTFTHAGVTYDLTAKYRDKDGDGWMLRRSPDGRDVVEAQMTPVEDDEWGHYTLPTLVTLYGPLTRI